MSGPVEWYGMQIVLFLILGFFIGGMSGMLGIGGGVVLVPVLMLMGIEPQTRAQGIALAVLAVPVVLPGVFQYLSNKLMDYSDIGLAALLAIGFFVGTYAGAKLVPYIDRMTLRMIFGFMLMVVALRYLVLSDTFAASALFGLLTFAGSWLSYRFLRALGRKHMVAPVLGDKIRDWQSPPDEPDYTI